VTRQSPNRPAAEEPVSRLDESGGSVDPDEVDRTEAGADADAAAPVDRSLWEETRIDPIEIALPSGSGLTLRAYRLSTEITPTDVTERDEDDPFLARSRPRASEEDDDEVVILDEEFAEALQEEEEEEKRSAEKDGSAKAADGDAEDEAADEADKKTAQEPPAEEVPVFLSHRGKLLLFKTPEALVSFVRSGAPHDLAQLDTWNQLVERIEPAHVVPLEEDTYELDLVVENLRGGHDVWNASLLIKAGEVARDLAYALRMPALLDMLSPGSSLDDLDEALRATVAGGFSAFRGRRRLKKIGAQTASLGWRTIIGKISAVVDWRD